MKFRVVGVLLCAACICGQAHAMEFDDVAVTNGAGVAPFAVFFDAEIYGAAYSDEPFHALEYRWDFGDSANPDATWDYGARPGEIRKNETTGPVAAHVYEEAGLYTATLTIWDGSEEAAKTVSYNIEVTDPDVVFADTTVCVSTDGDFTDAPAGATQVTSNEFDSALSDALADGAKRILFKAGQTFDFSSSTTVNVDGPVLIGSFGDGDKPILNLEDSYSGYYVVYATSDGVRFMDFEIDGNELTDPNAIRGMQQSGNNCLMLRVYGHDLGYLAGPSGDNSAIVECECDNIVGGNGNMPIYAQDVFGLFIAGCRFNNNGGGEYNVRYQGGTEGIISNNTFEHCGDGKMLLTIRGDYTQTTYTSGRHVVNDNHFDGTECVGLTGHVGVTPQNKERNEKIADVIYERNYHTTADGSSNRLLDLNCRYVSVRNNLFDSSNGSIYPVISVSYAYNEGGLPYPSNIYVYHNTFFTSTASGVTGITLFNADGPAYDCIIKNNFMYAPNATNNGENNGSAAKFYTDYGTNNTFSSNTENYSTSETEIKDEFTHFTVQPPGDDPDDWRILSDSYAADRGEDVPVWSDFFRTPLNNSSARNLGAVRVE